MQNRISFLQRIMDEVKRQGAVPAGDLDTGIDAADDGQFPESAATPLQPLQLFVDVDTIRTLVADALEALRWSETRICTTAARTAAWERAVEQRRHFLAWLGTNGHKKVFLAMYPEYLLNDGTDESDEPDVQMT
jgi:hypothetical protein